MTAERLLTVPQVAEELQVTSQTIRNWIDAGTLPAVRVGRAFRLRRADVDTLLDRSRVGGGSRAGRRELWNADADRLPRRDESTPASTLWGSRADARPLVPR
ncbi:MAG: helix-turn-helix domain-containing protein [Solirubrobacteraceae bacterium]